MSNLFTTMTDGFIADLRGGGRASPEILHYRKNPVDYFVDRLRVKEQHLRWSKFSGYSSHAWDGTPDPLALVLDSLAEGKDVGIESGTGTGKTFLGAGIICWFLECWENSIVVTLAPKADQLKLHIWKELWKQWPAFKARNPMASLTTLSLKMRGGEDWAATGFPVQVRSGEDVATKAAGFHAEHMMFIFEETPGIELAVMNAVENTCTAPHNLRLGMGNPDHQADSLHLFCEKRQVISIRASSLDHPNVVLDDPTIIPGAVSTEKIEDRRINQGEESRMFKSRVRGICAAEAANAMIKWKWLVAASARKPHELPEEVRVGPPAMGVDVANSQNGDEAAIASGLGPILSLIESRPCPDASELGTEVHLRMQADGVTDEHVGVDAVGVGSSTMNKLKEHKRVVVALQSSGAPVPHDGEEVFGNLRAQMWWQFRLDAQKGEMILPFDVDLFTELTTPTWETRAGKIYVQEKKEMKKLLGRSPNSADAVVYWNWIRKRRGGATGKGASIDF